MVDVLWRYILNAPCLCACCVCVSVCRCVHVSISEYIGLYRHHLCLHQGSMDKFTPLASLPHCHTTHTHALIPRPDRNCFRCGSPRRTSGGPTSSAWSPRTLNTTGRTASCTPTRFCGLATRSVAPAPPAVTPPSPPSPPACCPHRLHIFALLSRPFPRCTTLPTTTT